MNSQPTCQILTSQSIKTGRRAWPTRDHVEKSQRQLPSPPVMAGWIFASKVNLKCILKNWTWSWGHLKTSNLSVNIKLQTNTRPWWVNSWACDKVRCYWSLDTQFWQLSQHGCAISRYTWAPKLAGKCEAKNFLGWTDFLSYGAPL